MALTASSNPIPINAYLPVVATWTDSVGHLYVQGVEVGTPLTTGGSGCLVANAGAVAVNAMQTTGTGGGISELAIYSYPLSALQVRAHYEARTVGATSLTHGPTITGEERTSPTDPFGISTRWALGQLQGIGDYTAPAIGFWAGDSAATWVSADALKGFRIGHASATTFHAKPNGDLDLSGNLHLITGGNVASAGHWSLTSTTGLTFAPSASGAGNVERSVNWSGGSRMFEFAGDLYLQGMNNLVLQSVPVNRAVLLQAGQASMSLSGLSGAVSYTFGSSAVAGTVSVVRGGGGGIVGNLGSAAVPWHNVYTQVIHVPVGGTYTAGQTVTVTVRNAAGTGTCTLVFTSGIKTGGTC